MSRSHLVALVLFAAVLLLPAVAAADRWICPGCPDQIVERPEGSETLECPACGKTYTQIDLAPPVAYICSRTRDAEVAWVCGTEPDKCQIYRFDGIEAEDAQGKIWVPWSLVDWFIPRQRILRLTTGRELHTDYASSPERCPKPPKFTFEVVDSLTFPGQAPTFFKQTQSETLAELFVVGMSPEARDSARVRFIAEVEAGKHPRLPRTQPRLYYASPVNLTPDLVKLSFKGEADFDVRVHESRGTIGVRMVKSTGNAKLDEVALTAVRASAFTPGGEMGVGVPAWVRAKVIFDGAAGKIDTEASPHGFWRR